MTGKPFLAVDWGTTNCRAWVVDAWGRAGPRKNFPLGVASLAPGEAAYRFQQEVRPGMGANDLPALMTGMIGSTLGWVEAPYAPTPADLAGLAARLLRLEVPGAAVALAPGVRTLRPDGAPDVMRGEETQILGWLAGAADRRQGSRLIYHPGTHGKWVRVVDGRIEAFATVMTGELLAGLSHAGVLRSPAPAPGAATDWDAFDLGLAQAGDGATLIAQLFTARSRVVGGDLPAASQRDYLSGLLIGADLASGPAVLGASLAEPVAVITAPALAAPFARALARTGRPFATFDGEVALLAGLTALAAHGAFA